MEAQVVINTCHLGQVALLTSTKEQRRRIMQFTADDKVPRFGITVCIPGRFPMYQTTKPL